MADVEQRHREAAVAMCEEATGPLPKRTEEDVQQVQAWLETGSVKDDPEVERCMLVFAQALADAEQRGAESAKSEAHLLGLLARIHRDGGHHTVAHGIEQSVEDAHEAVVTLLAAVDGAKAEAQPAGTGWVSVEERLPEPHVDVQIYETGGPDQQVALWHPDRRKWFAKRYQLLAKDVSHWRPLPDPPPAQEPSK